MEKTITELEKRLSENESLVRVAIQEGREFSLEVYKEHLRLVESEIIYSNANLFRRSGKTPKCIKMFKGGSEAMIAASGMKDCRDALEDYLREDYRPRIATGSQSPE